MGLDWRTVEFFVYKATVSSHDETANHFGTTHSFWSTACSKDHEIKITGSALGSIVMLSDLA